MKISGKKFRAELTLKEETDPGVFYFEGVVVSGRNQHEIYGYYHNQDRPRPHYVWIMHSPTLNSRSACYWEKQITFQIKENEKTGNNT